MSRKILVTVSPIYDRAVRRCIACLEQDGFEVHYLGRPDEGLTQQELATLLQGVEIYVVGNARVPGSVLGGLSRLRLICKYGVGVDNIDLAAATERGILVTNASGANAVSVAEMTIGLLLCLSRKLNEAEKTVREDGWRVTVGEELSGRTLGIIGLGNIGQQVAIRARAFGMRVLANDILDYPQFCSRFGVEPACLDTVLGEADAVTLHVPLTSLTRHMIGENQLNRMKKGSLLIHTARGGVVDERALCCALSVEHLGGAAVDVFEQEPLGPSPLRCFENVILTPHIAGITYQAAERIANRTLENVAAYAAGRLPPDLVNSVAVPE